MTLGMMVTLVMPLLLSWTEAAPAAALPYHIDPEKTLFAVVTHPAGVFAWLGHRHLISAASYTAELRVDEGDLGNSSFQVTIPVAALAIDAPAVSAAVLPRLRAFGVLDEQPQLSVDDVATIRERMDSPAQLDAGRAPLIEARVTALHAVPLVFAGRDFTGSVELALTLHQHTVTRIIPATIRHGNGHMTAIAMGVFRFTEFGIQPFQTAFGLLQNADDFYLYAELAAHAP